MIGPCGALLGANPNEIQMLLMPLVLNTAFTTTLLQKRRVRE